MAIDRSPAEPGVEHDLLDAWLDQATTERSAWLDALDRRDPRGAAGLRAMLALDEQAQAEGWLRNPPHRPVPSFEVAAAGMRCGAYTLVERVGAGGMGEVWRAERSDGQFQRVVAIKLLHAESQACGTTPRLKLEAGVLARLSHAHIASLIDADTRDDGRPYLVLEWVDGEPMDRACDALRLGVAQRIELMLEVMDAVAHAHGHLVVHQDIKPANVLIDTRHRRVKLLDFGIAHLLGDRSAAYTDESSTVRALTPRFAAPEQLAGGGITTATDIHALGLLLFTLLTGQAPGDSASPPHRYALPRGPDALVSTLPRASAAAFDAGDPQSPVRAFAASQRACTPRSLSRALRGDLDCIIARATARDPQQRYPTVEAMAADLRNHLARRPVSARPPHRLYLLGRAIQRRRAFTALAVSALLGMAVSVHHAWTQAEQARIQRDAALAQQRTAEAVKAFTADLMAVASPDGQPMSPEAAVDHAESLARQLYSQQPAVLAELLLVIGGKNTLLQRRPLRETNFSDAAEAAAQADDAPLRALTQCYAINMDGSDAAVRVQAITRTLAHDPRFARARYHCHSFAATLMAWAGRAAEAQEHADASEAALAELGPQAVLLEAEVHETRGDVARGRGADAEADQHYARAIEAWSTTSRGRGLNVAHLLNYRVVMQLNLGRPQEALALTDAIAELMNGLAAAGRWPAYMLGNRGAALIQLGRLDEAELVLREAIVRAEATGSQPYLARAQARMAELLLMRDRNPRETTPLIEAVEAYASRTDSASHRASAGLLRARAALASTRPAEAVTAAQAAITAVTANRFHEALALQGHLLHAHATLAQGPRDVAMASADRALKLARQHAGAAASSTWIAEAQWLRAQSWPDDDSAGKLAAVDDAVREWSRHLGADHPLTHRAQVTAHTLRQSLEIQLAQAAGRQASQQTLRAAPRHDAAKSVLSAPALVPSSAW